MKNYFNAVGMLVILLVFPFGMAAQSDLDRILKGGELVIGGLSIFKILNNDSNKNESKPAALAEVPKVPVSKIVESFCVRNELAETMVLKLTGTDKDGSPLEKEMIIRSNDEECLYELPKGIWTYVMSVDGSETVYKKGQYRMHTETVAITLKDTE